MCDCHPDCQRPQNLKGKPEDCTPEQIEICHSEMENHPCENTDDDNN